MLCCSSHWLHRKPGPLTVGPDYKAPTNAIPTEYKGEQLGNWKTGQPLDNVPKGNWWAVFNDPSLNALESQALQANQGLKAAIARVDQSRATARVARADLLPYLSADPSFTRQRYSPNQDPSFGSITANSFSAPLDLSYELDLWGRVRRGFESARDDAQASLANYYNVLLTLQSDVAQNYFALRSLDAEIAIVAGTVDLWNQQVRLVRSRFEGGVGSELEVAQAQTELATTEAEAAALAHQRDELENAIAILVGENPTTFKLVALEKANEIWNPQPPVIPAGLPADLLERRPDVAAAERQLASANARIGVAKGAFSPSSRSRLRAVSERRCRIPVQLEQSRLVFWPQRFTADFCWRTQPGKLGARPRQLLTKASRAPASRCSWPSATWRTAFPESAS